MAAQHQVGVGAREVEVGELMLEMRADVGEEEVGAVGGMVAGEGTGLEGGVRARVGEEAVEAAALLTQVTQLMSGAPLQTCLG